MCRPSNRCLAARRSHDVVESRDLGPDPGDEQLLSIAHSQGRVLVTIDTDFGRLIFRDRQKQSGLVRLADVPAAMRIQIVEAPDSVTLTAQTPPESDGILVCCQYNIQKSA